MNDKPVLKTPGEMISEAREAQDLTIAQLSERTKIPPKVLTALELDEYHKISGPLYIKSFLRTCASDLGLEPEIVLGLYNKISGEQGGGPGGPDMTWDEDKVQVSRIGLPWVPIILGAGIVAILVGAALFGMRSCAAGKDEAPDGQEEVSTTEDLPASGDAATVAGLTDSVSGDDGRRESLIPAGKEAELKVLASVETAGDPAADQEGGKPHSFLTDTLSFGWQMTPPASVEEKRASGDDSGQDNGTVGGAAEGIPQKPVAAPVQDDAPAEVVEVIPGEVPAEIPADSPADSPETVTEEMPEPTEQAATVKIVAADQPGDSAAPTGEWIDSAWPLVLRIVVDSPQRIRVRRDGDREFSEVRWPAASDTVPEVPAAGFQAGRAYRQGGRLTVFWGADDHFSLILERVSGVEVAVNGRIKDISKLRTGQELILDARSAGSSSGR